jgi:DNA repair exonuclease SbcCD ATPase subunit
MKKIELKIEEMTPQKVRHHFRKLQDKKKELDSLHFELENKRKDILFKYPHFIDDNYRLAQGRIILNMVSKSEVPFVKEESEKATDEIKAIDMLVEIKTKLSKVRTELESLNSIIPVFHKRVKEIEEEEMWDDMYKRAIYEG